MSDFRCEPLAESNAPKLAELFDRASHGCYCQWWHFEGDKNAWLARLALEPEANRRALLEAPRGPSSVAFDGGGAVVGFLRLEAAHSLPKLYRERVYRDLPCLSGSRTGVYTVGCFFVEEAHRRRGVARTLLRHAIGEVRARGGTAIEAFPRRGEGLPVEQAFTGPFELFMSEGFTVVHDFAPYPVLRLSVS
jgi:GNAT superfamily N-acetyltransferase